MHIILITGAYGNVLAWKDKDDSQLSLFLQQSFCGYFKMLNGSYKLEISRTLVGGRVKD